MATLDRPVRVRYTRDVNGGWNYTVIAADSLTWLGGGWSAGKKRDAQDSFRSYARERGWVERDERQARMKGAA